MTFPPSVAVVDYCFCRFFFTVFSTRWLEVDFDSGDSIGRNDQLMSEYHFTDDEATRADGVCILFYSFF